MSTEEKKNNRIGLGVSVGLHVLLLVLFFFVLAWKEPDPPLPQYGIELNFGLDEAGSGETPQPKPAKVVQEEIREEVVEPKEKVEEVVETQQPKVVEEVEEVIEEPAEVQPEESPVVVKEVVKPQPKTVAEPKKEVKPQEVAKEAPKQPTTTANQGDNVDKVGDKGKEEGKIDARALYGAKGSDKGASLQMTGWNWDYIPRPDDKSSESGSITFQITIDDQGYVTRVVTLEKSVSPEVERIYREEVERLTFSRTSDNLKPAPTSTGKVTFIITSR